MTIQDFEGTRVDEISDGIFRISTSVASIAGGGITFNQYLLIDDEPLLFHTGKRRMFSQVQQAVAHVLPLERLRWISFSHFEADECGALNQFLAAAPHAVPLCGRLLAMLSMNDIADREAQTLGDGEILQTGRFRLQWLDTPHLPHGWEAGLIMEHATGTLLCSDLFADGGTDHPAIFEGDILGPSDAFRRKLDFYTHTKETHSLLARLAALKPNVLARCMAALGTVTARSCCWRLRIVSMRVIAKHRNRSGWTASIFPARVPKVVEMLDGMVAVALENRLRYRPLAHQVRELSAARICFDHLAGRLGVDLADFFTAHEYILTGDDAEAAVITQTGTRFLTGLP